MRRDSLDFDTLVKKYQSEILANTGANLNGVQITKLIAKCGMNADQFISQFNIIIGKRGKPKSII